MGEFFHFGLRTLQVRGTGVQQVGREAKRRAKRGGREAGGSLCFIGVLRLLGLFGFLFGYFFGSSFFPQTVATLRGSFFGPSFLGLVRLVFGFEVA